MKTFQTQILEENHYKYRKQSIKNIAHNIKILVNSSYQFPSYNFEGKAICYAVRPFFNVLKKNF